MFRVEGIIKLKKYKFEYEEGNEHEKRCTKKRFGIVRGCGRPVESFDDFAPRTNENRKEI